MPAKRKAAARGRKEAIDSEEESPKRKKACPPKPRAKKSGAYKMPPPLPRGEELTDLAKQSWKLEQSIGKGGFGEIYRAVPVGSTQGADYVIKIEPHENGPLFSEIAFYCRVAKEDKINDWVKSHKLAYLAIPKFISQGRHQHGGLSYRFLVMHCFGEDVEKKFNQCGRQFSIKTVCHLALRILEALQYLHESEYAHGDIKGTNILTGLHPSHQHEVYLVDYGLAYRYRPQGQHKEYKEDPRRKHDGTLEFTSIDAHKGVTPSPRGDLEILGYCLLLWSASTLPWDHYVQDHDQERVAQMKIRFRSDIGGLMQACFPSGQPRPSCLREYMSYVHSLGYSVPPDYTQAKQMFVKELGSWGYRDDGAGLDWSSSGKRKKSKAAVCEETDNSSPAKSAKPTVSSSDAVGATCVPAEPDGPKKKGSRRTAVKPIAKGKTRQVSLKDSVALVDPIIPVSCSSLSGGVPDTCTLPQVSYPKELGYTGNTCTLEPSKCVRPKAAARKKPSVQIIEQALTSTKRKVQCKRTSPVRRSPRIPHMHRAAVDTDSEDEPTFVKHRRA